MRVRRCRWRWTGGCTNACSRPTTSPGWSASELEGDRFAHRIDLEAAWRRGIRTVDTTNGSSYPVAEWALALLIVWMRNAAAHFRNMIEPRTVTADDVGSAFPPGELYGSAVGLIGCGHIGRVAGAANAGDGGADRRARARPAPARSVFVNVSRGKVVDSDALVARLRRGDVCAGIDVFDPEPIPAEHPIKTLPNVFLTPHIASRQARRPGRFFALMVDELERFFAGHETLFDLTPRSLANRRGDPQRR